MVDLLAEFLENEPAKRPLKTILRRLLAPRGAVRPINVPAITTNMPIASSRVGASFNITQFEKAEAIGIISVNRAARNGPMRETHS
jgi:hypothetical protein